jgi:RNA polymerase sigma-70 factor (ECF subfamily)
MDDADRAYMLSVARRIVRDPAEAEDVTQDAMLLAHRFRDRFRGDAGHRTWLYRIVTSAALSRLRRRRAERRRLDALADHIQISVDTGASPAVLLERARAAAELTEVVNHLDEKYRSVVAMRLADDLAEREIAEALGLPLSTVKIRIFRARRQLRELLGRADGEQARGRVPAGGGEGATVG